MTATSSEVSGQTVQVGETEVHLLKGGSGRPVLVLHGLEGPEGWLAFHEALAANATVYAPDHPGFGETKRPDWLESISDQARFYLWFLQQAGIEQVDLVGFGIGGWIAAEMATMAPRAFRRLVLVGAMGIKPERGEIADQALVSYIDYVRLGFADQGAFDRIYGAEPPTATLEQWDLNREMTFRIAWKPYMYNPTLPPLLGGVQTETLIVWGRQDRIVPVAVGEQYARALPKSRLSIIDGAGHFLEMEQPEALAKLIVSFAAQS